MRPRDARPTTPPRRDGRIRLAPSPPEAALVQAASSARWSRQTHAERETIVLENGELSIKVDHASAASTSSAASSSPNLTWEPGNPTQDRARREAPRNCRRPPSRAPRPSASPIPPLNSALLFKPLPARLPQSRGRIARWQALAAGNAPGVAALAVVERACAEPKACARPELLTDRSDSRAGSGRERDRRAARFSTSAAIPATACAPSAW